MYADWGRLQIKLAKAISAAYVPGKRQFINKTGNLVKNLTSADLKDRLAKYASARRMAVAKLMVLGEVLRDTEALERFGGRVDQIAPAGAFWQLFQGTSDFPACHTSPALLTFNGHLPTLVAKAADVPAAGQFALQMRLVETFGHCVLMPRFVNQIDEALDDTLGGPALTQVMKLMLSDPKATARDGTRLFLDAMKKLLPRLFEQDPDGLVRVLGYLEAESTGEPADSVLDLESATANRLDDPNHQYIAALETVAQSDPPAQEIKQFREQVLGEVQGTR